MLQCEYNQLLENLSWENVGQTIVDTVGQALNVEIVILYWGNPQKRFERYFIYQKPVTEIQSIDRDLIKLTVKSIEELSIEENLVVDCYKLQQCAEQSPTYWACLKANVCSTVSIPLFFQQDLVASLTIHRCYQTDSWSTTEVQLAKTMATQAALNISQILAYQKIHILAKREKTINRIITTIRSSLEPPVMFAAIARELGEALQVDGCTLSLWTKDDEFVRCVGLYNPHETQAIVKDSSDWQQATKSFVPISENPLLQALLFTKKPVVSQDLERQKQLARYELPLHSRARALLIVPLIVDDEIIGSITLRQSDNSRTWEDSDIELAEMVASQAAIAISQVLAYEQVKILAHREATVNRITATIRSSLEPPVMFAAIARELGEALQVDGCTLSLWTKDDEFVKCVGLYNPRETQTVVKDSPDWQQATKSVVPIRENPILQALLFTKKPVISRDLKQQKQLARYELPLHSKARALLIVPLIVDDEIIGSITLRQSDNSRSWQESEIELAEAVASQAAIAVQQAKLYATTKKQAKQLQIKEQKVRDLNNYLTESVLKRFLPESIVNKAAEGKLVLDLSPEPRRVTILFCDLVGFTNLSSQIGSRLLAELLDEYLEAMSQAVFERGGTVDKFIGDAIMAMFGAPEDLSRREQAERAIATAKSMHFNLQQLNQKWQAKGLSIEGNIPHLKMRCGIHQGRAIVGMFGGRQRKDYTAIGKVVNIAARLQTVAIPNSILISERVANCLPDLKLGQVQLQKLKGLDGDFRTFAIAID
jgi:GAF domain-containing protein